jgi:mRNA interferase MazF
MCVLTRDAAIDVLNACTCAPITRTVRGIRSEVPVGQREGLPDDSVINCDSVVTIPVEWFDRDPVGRLDLAGVAALDQALRYSLDIHF